MILHCKKTLKIRNNLISFVFVVGDRHPLSGHLFFLQMKILLSLLSTAAAISTADYFPSFDGKSIFFTHHSPNTTPVARVLAVHGLADKIENYGVMFELFSKFGIETLGMDMRGFGQTAQKNALEEGVCTIDDTIKDLILLDSHHKNDGIPKFLFGHSYGGLTVLAASKRFPKVSGIIAQAPAIESVEKVPPWAHLLFAASNFAPALDEYQHARKIGRKKNVEFIHDKVSVKLVKNLLYWQKAIKDDGVNVPLFISHSELDPITSFEASRELFAHVLVNDKEFYQIQGRRHDLHNGERRQKLFEKYIDWILARSNKDIDVSEDHWGRVTMSAISRPTETRQNVIRPKPIERTSFVSNAKSKALQKVNNPFRRLRPIPDLARPAIARPPIMQLARVI